MKRILVAFDGSDHSRKALELAADLAGKYDAELLLLHVVSDRPLTEGERHMAEVEYLDDLAGIDTSGIVGPGADPRVSVQRVLQQYGDVALRFREAIARRLLHEAETSARKRGAATVQQLTEAGDPASLVLRAAHDHAVDMIVMGSRGLGDAQGLLFGSVSHKVAHLAACTCVTVK